MIRYFNQDPFNKPHIITKLSEVSILSNSNLSANLILIASSSASAIAQASISINYIREIRSVFTITTTSNISTLGYSSVAAETNISSTSDLSLSYIRQVKSSITLTGILSNNIKGNSIYSLGASFNSTSDIFSNYIRLVQSSISLVGVSSNSIKGNTISSSSSSFLSGSDIVSNCIRVVNSSISMTGILSNNIKGNSIYSALASAASIGNLTINYIRTIGSPAQLTASSSLSITYIRIVSPILLPLSIISNIDTQYIRIINAEILGAGLYEISLFEVSPIICMVPQPISTTSDMIFIPCKVMIGSINIDWTYDFVSEGNFVFYTEILLESSSDTYIESNCEFIGSTKIESFSDILSNSHVLFSGLSKEDIKGFNRLGFNRPNREYFKEGIYGFGYLRIYLSGRFLDAEASIVTISETNIEGLKATTTALNINTFSTISISYVILPPVKVFINSISTVYSDCLKIIFDILNITTSTNIQIVSKTIFSARSDIISSLNMQSSASCNLIGSTLIELCGGFNRLAFNRQIRAYIKELIYSFSVIESRGTNILTINLSISSVSTLVSMGLVAKLGNINLDSSSDILVTYLRLINTEFKTEADGNLISRGCCLIRGSISIYQSSSILSTPSRLLLGSTSISSQGTISITGNDFRSGSIDMWSFSDISTRPGVLIYCKNNLKSESSLVLHVEVRYGSEVTINTISDIITTSSNILSDRIDISSSSTLYVIKAVVPASSSLYGYSSIVATAIILKYDISYPTIYCITWTEGFIGGDTLDIIGGLDIGSIGGIVKRETTRSLVPEFKLRKVNILGRNGCIILGNKIKDREIELSINIESNSPEELIEAKRKLALALDPSTGPKELRFEDDPDRIYFVKYSGKISLKEWLKNADITIPLKMTDPYIYSDEKTAEGNCVIVNEGVNTDITIEIQGPATAPITIQIGDYTMIFNQSIDSGKSLIIDGKKPTVEIDGVNYLPKLTGNIPILPPGNVSVSCSSGYPIWRWRNKWLV